MATPAVHLLVELSIDDGELEAFQNIAREMIAGSRTEPGTLSYEWYLHDDGKRCRLFETYATGDDLLAHFNGPVVQQLIPKLLEHSILDRLEIFGDAGPQVEAALARFGARFFPRWGGLDR